jgi:hypothetical protein
LLFGVMECYKRTERALRVLCLQNILGAALYCNNISAEGPTVAFSSAESASGGSRAHGNAHVYVMAKFASCK